MQGIPNTPDSDAPVSFVSETPPSGTLSPRDLYRTREPLWSVDKLSHSTDASKDLLTPLNLALGHGKSNLGLASRMGQLVSRAQLNLDGHEDVQEASRQLRDASPQPLQTGELRTDSVLTAMLASGLLSADPSLTALLTSGLFLTLGRQLLIALPRNASLRESKMLVNVTHVDWALQIHPLRISCR